MTADRKSMMAKIDMNNHIKYEVEENPYEEEIQPNEAAPKKRGDVANS